MENNYFGAMCLCFFGSPKKRRARRMVGRFVRRVRRAAGKRTRCGAKPTFFNDGQWNITLMDMNSLSYQICFEIDVDG